MQMTTVSYEDALQHTQQLLRDEQPRQAAYLARQLLQIQPTNPVPYYLLGLALSRAKDFPAAREALQLALTFAPTQIELWQALAQTHDAEQNFPAAQRHYEDALKLVPDSLPVLYALARNLEAQKKTEQALSLYQKMTGLDAVDTDVREGFWRCLRNLQQREQLCDPAKLPLATTPILRIIRAKTLIELGTAASLAEAETLLQETLQEQPKRPDALAALSLLYRVRGEFDRCLPIASTLVETQPERTEGYLGCIESLIADGRDAEAWQIGLAAAKHSGSHAMLLHAATYIANIPLSNKHIDQQRERFKTGLQKILATGAKAADPVREAPLTYFYFAYHGRNNKSILSYVADNLRKLAPALNYQSVHINRPRKIGPLRLVFISTFMRDHPVGRCYQPLIEALAQHDVSIQVFTKLKEGDRIQDALRQQHIDVQALPLELAAARAQIAAFEPDVLLYGDIGMDNFTYYLAFSRLAKRQCLLPGHPETSGIDTLDFFITQQDMEGPDAQSRYREKPVLLKHFAMAYPAAAPVADTRTRAELDLPRERFYLVPAKLQKIHPDFDQLLAAILRRDTTAVALYFEDSTATGWGKSLRARLARQFPDLANRIRFRAWAEKADFQPILSHADAILDPIHFGLGTTAIYAFAQGQPIITRPFSAISSRPASAMLKQIGVTDTIVDSDEAYINVAVDLANNPEKRREIGNRISAGFNRLFDAGNAADELYAFLQQPHNATPSRKQRSAGR